VNFIIDRDPKGVFKFAPLQSQTAIEILSQHGVDIEKMDSIVFYSKGMIYQRSRAALEIAKRMSGGWPLFYVFMIVLPFIRNFFYDLVARNRYKWFGKRETCRIPTPDLKSRFLDS
jgi:predicted DCC family thiol-disulfide oxidoreductase YuxK